MSVGGAGTTLRTAACDWRSPCCDVSLLFSYDALSLSRSLPSCSPILPLSRSLVFLLSYTPSFLHHCPAITFGSDALTILHPYSLALVPPCSLILLISHSPLLRPPHSSTCAAELASLPRHHLLPPGPPTRRRTSLSLRSRPRSGRRGRRPEGPEERHTYTQTRSTCTRILAHAYKQTHTRTRVRTRRRSAHAAKTSLLTGWRGGPMTGAWCSRSTASSCGALRTRGSRTAGVKAACRTPLLKETHTSGLTSGQGNSMEIHQGGIK